MFQDVKQPIVLGTFDKIDSGGYHRLALKIKDRTSSLNTQFDVYKRMRITIPFKRLEGVGDHEYFNVSPVDYMRVLAYYDTFTMKKLKEKVNIEQIDLKVYREKFGYKEELYLHSHVKEALEREYGNLWLTEINSLVIDKSKICCVNPIIPSLEKMFEHVFITYSRNGGPKQLQCMTNEYVYLFYRNLNVSQAVLKECLAEGYKVIVCDENPSYVGCVSLNASPFNSGYQVATNIDNFLFTTKMLLPQVEVSYKFLNPDIVSRFKRYVFVGIETLSYLKFLLLVDYQRTFVYEVIGFETNVLPKFKFESNAPALFLISRVGCNDFKMNENDAVFSIDLEREMSGKYLQHVLMVGGIMDINLLRSFGFLQFPKVLKNVSMYNDSLQSTCLLHKVQVHVPYIIRSFCPGKFTYLGGHEEKAGFYSAAPFVGDYFKVVFTKVGRVVYTGRCFHPLHDGKDAHHKHFVEVVKDVSLGSLSLMNFNYKDTRLKSFPMVFTTASLRKFLVQKNVLRGAISQYLFSLHLDRRLKFRNDWWFNPLGERVMFPDDLDLVKMLGEQNVLSRFDPVKLHIIQRKVHFEKLNCECEVDSDDVYVSIASDKHRAYKYYFDRGKLLVVKQSKPLISIMSVF